MQARGGWWANLATCQFCISVWSGIAGTALYVLPGGWYVNVALAAGGLVFFAAPIQALIEATVQRTQAETARLRAGK
jgi:hypothetical protein